MQFCLLIQKRAFDTIDHKNLLSKLDLYGFMSARLKRFRNYLTDRTQITVINTVNSNISFIHCGVPQGSILRPPFILNIYQ